MSHSVPTFLTRLRRHRGLWALVVAVLMIKLVAGTVCLTDGPGLRFASSPAPAAVASAQLPADVAAPLANDDSGTCLLGEPGGCHCACAHTVTLPTTSALVVPLVHVRFDAPNTLSGFTPATTGSLLRPPIA